MLYDITFSIYADFKSSNSPQQDTQRIMHGHGNQHGNPTKFQPFYQKIRSITYSSSDQYAGDRLAGLKLNNALSKFDVVKLIAHFRMHT